MTLTCGPSEPLAAAAAPKRKPAENSTAEISEPKKSRHESSSDSEKVRMNPSQIEAEFRVLQSLIPHIADRQQLSEVMVNDLSNIVDNVDIDNVDIDNSNDDNMDDSHIELMKWPIFSFEIQKNRKEIATSPSWNVIQVVENENNFCFELFFLCRPEIWNLENTYRGKKLVRKRENLD